MQVDLAAARAFLDLLDPAPRFWHVQTVDDNQAVKADALVRPAHFARAQLEHGLATLVPYNDQGAGVFVGVNAHGHGPRQKWNTKYARAITLDLDGSAVEPVLHSKLIPSLVVESSPGHYHCYWLTQRDFPIKQYDGVQRRLAYEFGGDPAICIPNHVLRLPGFLHRKAEPFMVHLMHVHMPKVQMATGLLLATFPPLVPEVGEGDDIHRGMLTAEELADCLEELDILAYAAHDDWFGLMCAAWYLTDGEGEDVWAEWSATNPAFANLTRETHRRWRSLRSRPAGAVVTGATMLKALHASAAAAPKPEYKESATARANWLTQRMADREDELAAGGDADQTAAYVKANHG